MAGSNSTMESGNQDVFGGLIDKFKELPDELILKILKKIQDIKTLIRCSAISKHFNCFMPRIHAVSLIILYPGEDDSHRCSQSHCHIPLTAIASIMKVFTNLKSVEVEYCRCSSLNLRPLGRRFFRVKGTVVGDRVRFQQWTALAMGFARNKRNKSKVFELGQYAYDISAFQTGFESKSSLLLQYIVSVSPETTRSIAISTAKLPRSRSRGHVFLTTEQLRKLEWGSSYNEEWLEDLHNHAACWLKGPLTHDHSSKLLLREYMWAILTLESPLIESQEQRNKKLEPIVPILMERDVKSFFSGFEFEDEQ